MRPIPGTRHDYTLLACAIVVTMGFANFTGAAIADAAGYAPTFLVGFVLSRPVAWRWSAA